jgi:hypothetical protein
MLRQDFIKLYQNKINGILPEYRPDHYIDNDKIGSKFLKEWFYYDIDNCIKIIDITKEARQYIYNLKLRDKIKIYSYGNYDDVEIIKFSYKRLLDKKGNKIISSITIKKVYDNGNIHTDKIKIKDIIFKGNTYRDLFDSYLHTSGIFLNFSNYDIDQANKILTNYKASQTIAPAPEPASEPEASQQARPEPAPEVLK